MYLHLQNRETDKDEFYVWKPRTGIGVVCTNSWLLCWRIWKDEMTSGTEAYMGGYHLWEIGFEGVDVINVTQDEAQWRVGVNKLKNHLVQQNEGNFLPSCEALASGK
jgi:hypothetical protein